MNTKLKQPNGGALILVLMIFVAISLYCLYFVYDVTKIQCESNEFVYEQNLDSVIDSGLSHAKFLLETDLMLGPADDYRDIWVSIPRGKILSDRLSWSKYVSISTNLENQKWFELPGPTPATVLRYRFKLIDAQPVEQKLRSWEGKKIKKNKIQNSKFKIQNFNLLPRQPNTPAVWHNKKWVPTDDITAIDTKSFEKLVNKFESNLEIKNISQKKIAKIIDNLDGNYALNSSKSENTEPIQFDKIVTQTDTRWQHFDDTMRLGRYYEERGKHNFFLIETNNLFYNGASGKTNVEVKLEDEPISPNNLFGWIEYKKVRNEAGLPWWHENMWKGITVATGGGANFKYQPIISNKESPKMIFNDDNETRFSKGQTVTFHNWFSSLHSKMRLKYKKYGAKEIGTIFTAQKNVPDSFILKNIPKNQKYKISLVTGQKRNRKLEATVSFNGIDAYKKIKFNKNGFAELNEGEPTTPFELLIKSPKNFSGIFSLEGALLKQPEFIVLKNLSEKYISLKGWRFGYKFGNHLFWSPPISTSSYFHSKYKKVKDDLSPSIPPLSSVILTPDAVLFDYFAGANKNGKWGNSAAEGIPLIEIKNWNPKFYVKKARAGNVYKKIQGTDGGPNWMDPAEGFVWETEWNLYIPGIDWSKIKSLLEGEPVIFDPDGNEEKYPPIPATIIKQKKRILTIAISGTRKRFRPTKDATLTFCGIPDAVKEYFLITPEGKIAAHAKMPPRKLNKRKVLEEVILENDGTYKRKNFRWDGISQKLRHRKKTFQNEKLIFNGEVENQNDKYKLLKFSGFSCKSDWFYSDSLLLSFNNAIIKSSKSIKCVSDTAKIRRYENRWLIREKTENNFPTHSELTPFCNKIYVSGERSVSVEKIIPDAIKLFNTPGISPTQYVGETVVIGPYAAGGGLHVFGAPGSIEFEWKNINNIDFKNSKLTLFGKNANKWTSPSTESQYNNFTNQTVKLTVEIWNYKKVLYELRIDEKSFDSSDKLFLGKLNRDNLKKGCLRMKITTHRGLSPQTSALWLGGINIHPYAGNNYININTISLKSLLFICKGDTNAAIKILSELNGKKFNSIKSIPELENNIIAENKFIIRSDIFDLCIEAQVINKITKKILSKEKKSFKLDRSPTRLFRKRIKIAGK